MSDILQQDQQQQQQQQQRLYHPKRNITTSVVTAIYILGTKMTYDFHKNDNGNDFRRKSAIKSSSTTTTTAVAVEEEYDYDSSSTTKSNNNNNNRGTTSTVLGSAALCCGSCFHVCRDENDDGGCEETTTTTSFDFTYNNNNNNSNIITGDAFDIIFVESIDGQLYQNSDFLVSFTANDKYSHHKIVLEIENNNNDDGNNNDDSNTNNGNKGISRAWFPIIQKTNINNNNNIDNENCQNYNENDVDDDDDDDANDGSNNDEFDEIRFWGCCHPAAGTARPAKLSSLNATTSSSRNSTTNYGNSTSNNRNKRCHDDEATSKLKPFLKRGRNPIRYLLLDERKVVGVANANIFLWKYDDSVVVSDIDGTITKSNARGVLDTIVTDNYRHCHKDICNLLSHLASKPTTQIVYVTSRPLGLANPTRKFLDNLRQGMAKLPEGPLLGFGGKLPQLLLMELVSKTTHHFKSQTLWKQIVQPFRKAAKDDNLLVFLAGFGNSMMDVMAYHSVGIHMTRLFKISKDSKIVTFDKKGSSNSSKNSTTTVIDEETAKLTTSNDGILNFRPHKWYKERIGTVYFGYSDPRLLSLFNTSTETISSEEVQPKAWA